MLLRSSPSRAGGKGLERTLRRVSRSWSDLASLMNSVLSSTPLPSASTALNISRRTLLQRKQGQRRNGVLDFTLRLGRYQTRGAVGSAPQLLV